MLYIFHVDTGTTITFNIKLALQTVSQLMEAIERECGVLAVHQVLLMSGGETLEPNARVCSYSAGTDTNPIYLFSKAAIESQVPPTPSIYYGTGECGASSPVNILSLSRSAGFSSCVSCLRSFARSLVRQEKQIKCTRARSFAARKSKPRVSTNFARLS
nr:RB1-inducible coiled-coil protein 1-like [Megalopta genalis]